MELESHSSSSKIYVGEDLANLVRDASDIAEIKFVDTRNESPRFARQDD